MPTPCWWKTAGCRAGGGRPRFCRRGLPNSASSGIFSRVGGSMRKTLLVLAVLLMSQPAWAQLDLVGNWARRSGEDARALGGEGTHIGDYTGMPLTEAGRVRAETWDATVLSE